MVIFASHTTVMGNSRGPTKIGHILCKQMLQALPMPWLAIHNKTDRILWNCTYELIKICYWGKQWKEACLCCFSWCLLKSDVIITKTGDTGVLSILVSGHTQCCTGCNPYWHCIFSTNVTFLYLSCDMCSMPCITLILLQNTDHGITLSILPECRTIPYPLSA